MMKIHQLSTSFLMALVLVSSFDARLIRAEDWPQWQGPDRTNVSKETGLLKTWPKDGPKLLWTFEKAGVGYSGPAVVGDRLYTMGGREDTSYVFAIDVKSGKEIWNCPIGKLFKNGYGDGPRSTPTVDGDFLYALDAQGELICVEIASGKKRWAVNLEKDLKGEMMSGWGYSESPLVDGDQVVCCPGGKEGTVAALDKKTGKVLWRSKELTDNSRDRRRPPICAVDAQESKRRRDCRGGRQGRQAALVLSAAGLPDRRGSDAHCAREPGLRHGRLRGRLRPA
jgi:outer membrane protein assembly factor BamB